MIKKFSEWIYYSRFKIPFFNEESEYDKWFLEIIPALQGFTVGEMIFLVTYIASVAIYLLVSLLVTKIPYADILGLLSSFHMAVSLLPVVRNSIWLHLFGLSWDRALKWHRMAGRLTCIFVFYHAALMLNSIRRTVYSVSDLGPALTNRGESHYGFASCVILFFVFLTSVDYVRRNQFELFYIAHFLVFVSIIMAIYHNINTLWLVIFPLVLYVIDIFYRSNRYSNRAEITKLTNLEGDVVRVDITTKDFDWEPGCFILVNIPDVAYLEWHPFTISGFQPNKSRDNFSLHVKVNSSPKTFTNKLSLSKTSEIYIEGPYGKNSFPLFETESDYDCLVLCVGGIGSTPAISILQHLHSMYLQNKLPYKFVKLIWVVSDESAIHSWFPEILSDLQSASDRFELLLYVTNSQSKSTLTSISSGVQLTDMNSSANTKSAIEIGKSVFGSQIKVPINYARPQYLNLFTSFNQSANKIGVFSCGPSKMMSDVRSVCKINDYHLHEETFLF